jgi:hypothetical protein
VTDHQVTVQLFEWEIGSGYDPQPRAFAAQVVPTVLRHLELASAPRSSPQRPLLSTRPSAPAGRNRKDELWPAETSKEKELA